MRKQKVITLILLGVFLVGLSLLLYPSVSNYWNSITQSRAIVDYDTIVKSLSPKDYTAYFERAEEYNSELKALPFPLMEYQQISGYDDCLNAAGDGVIGYIDIDKIQVKLPIYHGTDPSILNHACGHIQGSSFPIAGKGTHVAISAHRGLPSAKLFSDLDKLEVGDTFRITVLDKAFIYEVDQIKTVLPVDVSELLIDEEKELCTLVTCTPYGINSHRLLVRGHRIESEDMRSFGPISDAFIIDRLIVTPVVAMDRERSECASGLYGGHSAQRRYLQHYQHQAGDACRKSSADRRHNQYDPVCALDGCIRAGAAGGGHRVEEEVPCEVKGFPSYLLRWAFCCWALRRYYSSCDRRRISKGQLSFPL